MSAVTNFDISRYDVERITASESLLAGESARRSNKEIVLVPEPVIDYITGIPLSHRDDHHQLIHSNNNNGSSSGSGWKMVLHQPPQHQQLGANNCDSFSVALQDLIGMDSGQLMVDESTKIGGHHFSDPSSLVTSLSSSREASPEKSGGPVTAFAKPNAATSWISAAHLPVFAAWNSS